MKRTFSALVISGALLCTLAVPGMAAEAEGQPGASAAASAPQAQTLPASVLYFGQVTQVVRDEAGTVTRLVLSSERYGEYIMNISSDTVWIDSGNRTASDPADLKEGESVYVFHSPISTRSLPPQSAAYAVVRNIPQDISCAQYPDCPLCGRLCRTGGPEGRRPDHGLVSGGGPVLSRTDPR